MADTDITGKTHAPMNAVGNQREDTITFTSANTEVTVQTRLAHVEHASLLSTDGGAAGYIYVNASTTADNAAGYGGQIYAESVTNAKVYVLVARGW